MTKKKEIGVSIDTLMKKGKSVEKTYGRNRDRVLSFLKANDKKGFTQAEIMKALNKNKELGEVSEQQVNNAVRALAKKGIILRKQLPRNVDGKMKLLINNFVNPEYKE